MCFIIAASLLLVGGCKKYTPPPSAETPLNAAMAKLNQNLKVPISPEVQKGLSALEYQIHEGHFSQALTAADDLVNAPGLSDAEKKALDEVRAQLKQMPDKSPAATAPGQ
jgi:hypothetical protein